MSPEQLDELEKLWRPVRDCWAERLLPNQPSNSDRLVAYLHKNLDQIIAELRAARVP